MVLSWGGLVQSQVFYGSGLYSVTMPSSSLPVRLVLAALLAFALLIAAAPVGSAMAPLQVVASNAPVMGARDAAPLAPSALPGAPSAPLAPPQPGAEMPVSLQLVSIDPTSLAPGGTVTAVVSVTNTSSEPLDGVALELRTRTSRVIDRTELAQWQADTGPDTSGAPLATSSPAALAPGAEAELTVQVSAEDLGYVDEPYYWGTRRISLTAVAGTEPLAAIRTFTVWRPADATDRITQSVLLPVAADDPAAVVTEPEEHARSAQDGALAQLQQLALREDVDWWLDPALLDAPAVPVDDAAADGSGAEDAEPTPQPVLEHAPDPVALEVAAALDEGVGTRTVLAMPYARADLAALQAAGADALAEGAVTRGSTTWDEAEILPRALALPLAGQQADADALHELSSAGATAAVVPSSSLRSDTSATVTPSSIAVFSPRSEEGGAGLPLLAPDPELSDTFGSLTGKTDVQQAKQRLLAETATIASEYTTAPRHLLISPPADAQLDAGSAAVVLDAFEQAPWLERGSTSALLDVAANGSWTTATRDESGDLLSLGRLDEDDVHPSAPGESGRWEAVPEATEHAAPDPQTLTELQSAWQELDTLAAVMTEVDSLEPARLLTLSGASWRWREDPEIAAQLADDAREASSSLLERIDVIPASGYNLISDSAGVPITVTNGLDTPITVRPVVSSDRPLVRVGEQDLVEVPARGQIDFTVQVEAIANGTVSFSVHLDSEDGKQVTEPAQVPLTVNPAWENWTTMLLVVAMGVLVVFGIARARRTGSSNRAPAVHAPEDPVELSRTGRSLPEPAAGESGPAPTGPGGSAGSAGPRGTASPGDTGDPGPTGTAKEDRA